ncbi:MAG TPA: retropepsin-like aspartic protease, partial [Bacteroidales bacterium]
MKKLFLISAIILLLTNCTQKLSKEQTAQLWKAYNEQNYFRLNKLVNKIDFKGTNPDFMLFKAKLGYVFNRPGESDSLINILLDKYSSNFNDTIIADLHLMKAVNNERLQNYKDALAEGKLVTEKYRHCFDSTFIAETGYDNEVREALANVPKMEINHSGEEKISMKRDMAGLLNVPVSLGNDSLEFVFDTGANISVIMESVAQKFGFKPLGKKVHIMAFTGKRLEA